MCVRSSASVVSSAPGFHFPVVGVLDNMYFQKLNQHYYFNFAEAREEAEESEINGVEKKEISEACGTQPVQDHTPYKLQRGRGGCLGAESR